MRSILLTLALFLTMFQFAHGQTLAHSYSNDHATTDVIERFAVGAGRILGTEIRVVGNNQMGRSRDYPDMLRYGKLEFAVVARRDLEDIPELGVFDLPFLISDRQALRSVLDEGPAWERLSAAFEASDLRLLALLDGSFRLIGFSQPGFETLFDLKGGNLRAVDRNSSELFTTIGVSTTNLPFGELAMALQAGVVDAYETTPEGVVQGRLGEVSEQILLTKHLYDPVFLVGSEVYLSRIDPHTLNRLLALAREIQALSFRIGEDSEQAYLRDLRGMGVDVRDSESMDEDRQWLIESSRYFYDEYATQVKGGAELVKFFLTGQ